ncbi:DnaJ domain-containing protein [Polyangium jinanense]|uniref:DnaJ domain-containing protein n=1 Tax=Polyangium jinanense TaxID=2829994 RepID=A0A9X3X8I2_9BACT|nr:DnaJ domain-containing protein [Polyangium jinanense]MDC3958339.1 DnaJ domain-containing protein [Polyangium jinanense]MDC3983326.1 DnaJ domain-containing protein [Polyangium jinanense]
MVRVPRPVPGCDIKSLPLRPDEAYLLSRIDGVVSERELSLITGLSQAEVTTALDRLFVLGAVDFNEPTAPVSRRAHPSVAPSSGATSTRGTEGPSSRTFEGGFRAGPSSRRFEGTVDAPPASRRSFEPLADLPPPTRRSIELSAERRSGADTGVEPPPATRRAIDLTVEQPRIVDPELEEPVDLDHAKKKRVLELYDALDERNHYELLGVSIDADKKQIKSAYWVLAPEFHPDKYFRKKLGTYKQRIEAIFDRLTLAHDVLTSKQRRAEYDTYLEQTRRNRTMAALLEHDPADIPAVVAAAEDAPGNGPPTLPGRLVGTKLASTPIRRTVADAGGTSPAPATPPTPTNDPFRRYDSTRNEARRLQLDRYVLAAKVALERKDLAAAANAYRLAVALAPEDDALARKAVEIQQQAAAELAEGFLRQAEYEASQGRWSEAAMSFANVCKARGDDPRPHERVAFCTLKTGQNNRRAIDFARRAVKLSPGVGEYRLTLARAYMAAGLETSARVEMERAAELSPNDARIREAIAQLRAQMKKPDGADPEK